MKKTLGILIVAATAIGILPLDTSSKDPQIGKKAPDFTLMDTKGTSHKLSDFKGKYVILEWVNHGCPFVMKHYESNNMQSPQKEMTEKGVVWLSICSSAAGKQGHMTPEEWNETTEEKGASPTAVLLDDKGKVGKLYGAKTTPHLFVIHPEGNLIYAGAIDDQPSYDKATVAGAKNYVRAAIEEAQAGKTVTLASTKSYGCSVKY